MTKNKNQDRLSESTYVGRIITYSLMALMYPTIATMIGYQETSSMIDKGMTRSTIEQKFQVDKKDNALAIIVDLIQKSKKPGRELAYKVYGIE